MLIKLPGLSSFYQPQGSYMITNKYTGSMGTDPLKGNFNRDIFCYKIQVVGDVNDPALKAECYIQNASMSGVKQFDQQEKTFEPTAEGLKHLNEWLDEQYKAHLDKNQ